MDEPKRLDHFGAQPARPAQPNASPEKGDLGRRDFAGRQWVTRPRPGVDRFASAWFIRRFIDADAKFVFALAPAKFPDAVPFDMYQPGVFRHHGDKCTFEVLQDRFGVEDQAVRKIGEIVHDLDLKDGRFKSPHAPTVGLLVEGFRASIAENDRLLDQGVAMFEALYQSLQGVKRPYGRARIC
jgi:hypothetical protein